jgi:branched-chain amino acid transport system permease protein
LINAIIQGIMMGGFYAALSLGLSISFGILDIVNIAHPVFIIFGAFLVYFLNSKAGLDPILAGALLFPLFFLLGVFIYQVYYHSLEKRGAESLRGLVFFFGLFAILEVGLSLTYGVDYRSVQTSWLGKSLGIGFVGVSYRLFIPFLAGVIMILVFYLFFSRTFLGLVARGVAQDSSAVRLMGANPTYIRTVGFGLSIGTTAFAGALLICISPVEPFLGREFIGRVFAITVLAGMGSIRGTLLAGVILAVAESLTATLGGPAWGLVVSFAILLIVLAVKPSGLLGSKG